MAAMAAMAAERASPFSRAATSARKARPPPEEKRLYQLQLGQRSFTERVSECESTTRTSCISDASATPLK